MARTTSYNVIAAQNTPPGSPSAGDSYLVTGTATSSWTSKENKIATFNPITSAWVFTTPVRGDTVFVEATNATYQWNGSAFSLVGSSASDLAAGTGAAVLSPAQITADQNDYAPTGYATAAQFRLSTDASRNLTGFAGGSAGRLVILHNVGSYDLTLKDESGSSTAANRFALGADLCLKPDHAIPVQYDATTSRWRAVQCMVSEAYGGTGRNRVPDPFTLEFYASSALAAGSSLRGILNSTDTGSAFEVPSGKTLKVLRAIGSVKNGATAGTYNDDLILRNVTDSTDTQVATNTGTASAEVYIHAQGTLDSPLATLAAGKRFSAGVRNRSGNPGAWDASYKHHVALVCVLE